MTTPTPSLDPRARLGIPAMLLAAGLQSLGPIIVKDASASGLTFAFNRLWVAGLLVLGIALVLGRTIDRRTFYLSLPGGVLFTLNLALFFTAVRRTSIANASVLTSIHPLAMMAVTYRLFGERNRKSDLLWAVLAVVGVGLVVFGANDATSGDLGGDLLALAAMFTFASYLAASKQARQELDALSYQAAYTLIAAVCMVPILALSGQGFAISDSGDWWLVLAMAVLPGGGHFLINFAHPYVRLVTVSLILLCIPAVSTLIAWWWLDESFTLVQGIGIFVVISALAFVVMRSQPPAAAKA